MGDDDQRDEELGSLLAAVGRIEAMVDQQSSSGPDVAGLRKESRRDSFIAVLIAILAAATIAFPYIVLVDNFDETQSERLVSLALALLALVAVGFLLLSERYRRASRTAGMKAHEFALLPEYERRLTRFQAQVLRIALAPRLFAGTSDQIDVLTEPEWPSTKELINVLLAAERVEEAE